MGIQVIDVKDGYAKVSLKITKDHINFTGVTHGGAIFTLADCAFAEAANFGEKEAVAIQADINFLKPSVEGDVLTAEAVRISESRRFSLYRVTVYRNDELIAFFSVCTLAASSAFNFLSACFCFASI